MKLSKKFKFLLLTILTIVLLLGATISYADSATIQPRTTEGITATDALTTTNTDENAKPSNSEKNAKDVYIFEDSVNIDYSVAGNVFIFARDVTISNRILGNVFVLAQNVNISSRAYINASLFVCAENVTIEGDIFDLYSLSNKLSLSTDARILRDVTAGGASLDLKGAINRNANLGFDSINVADSAKINGDLSYSSKTASIPEEIVKGEFSFSEMVVKEKPVYNAFNYLNDLLKVLAISIIIILVVVLATPKFAEKEQQVLENKTMATLGYGAIALIAIPTACFILFCTVLGIMPALAILFAYIFLISLAPALVSVPLSKMLCNKMNKNTKGMNILISILLVALIWLLKQIPVIGGLISLLVTLFGLGILAYSIIHKKVEIKEARS